MALEFGEGIKTANDYIKEIHELIGEQCPSVVVVQNGELIQATIEESWKEGGTAPVEEDVEVEKNIVNDDGEVETVKETQTRVVGYEEDYTEKKLTAKQKDDLQKYMEDNIKV